MKIFITGICGFLGSNLAEEALRRGFEVDGVDNLIGGTTDNLPAGAYYTVMNLQDRDSLERKMKGADYVIHTAAVPHEGLSVFSPAFVVDNVLTATTSAVSAAIGAGVKRFVNMSSMARYGTQDALPFTEDMTPRPQDPYGIAKVAAEDTGSLLSKVHGMGWVNIVPHNIYGRKQRYHDPFRNVAAIMVNRVLQGKQPIIYGDGTQKRCFSHISDVVEPIFTSLEAPVVGETINIGPDDEFITINQLAEAICELLDVPFDPIYFPDRPQEVKEANCSAQKARELLGYAPNVPLREGLQDLIFWVKERGPRAFDYHIPIEIRKGAPKTWTEQLI